MALSTIASNGVCELAAVSVSVIQNIPTSSSGECTSDISTESAVQTGAGANAYTGRHGSPASNRSSPTKELNHDEDCPPGTTVSENGISQTGGGEVTEESAQDLVANVTVESKVEPIGQQKASLSPVESTGLKTNSSNVLVEDFGHDGEVIFIVNETDCPETALELVIDNAKGDDDEDDMEDDDDDENGDSEDLRNDDEIILYTDPDGDDGVQRGIVEHEEVVGPDDGDGMDREDECDDDDSDAEQQGDGESTVDKDCHACSVCSKPFSSRAQMVRHRRMHTDVTTLSCTSCSRHFSNLAELEEHEETHVKNKKRFVCRTCGKMFSRRRHLLVHEDAHTDTRRYSCEQCGAAFRDPAHLHHHRAVHSDNRPFECKICGKAFKHGGQLHRHSQVHSGEHPYICNVCGRAYTTKHNLDQHLLVHNGSPYKCQYCGRLFSRNLHLINHVRTHTGERPHHCELCNASFTQSSGLSRHMRTLHPNGAAHSPCDKGGKKLGTMGKTSAPGSRRKTRVPRKISRKRSLSHSDDDDGISGDLKRIDNGASFPPVRFIGQSVEIVQVVGGDAEAAGNEDSNDSKKAAVKRKHRSSVEENESDVQIDL